MAKDPRPPKPQPPQREAPPAKAAPEELVAPPLSSKPEAKSEPPPQPTPPARDAQAKSEDGQPLWRYEVKYPGVTTKEVAAVDEEEAMMVFAAISGIVAFGHEPTVKLLGKCLVGDLSD